MSQFKSLGSFRSVLGAFLFLRFPEIGGGKVKGSKAHKKFSIENNNKRHPTYHTYFHKVEDYPVCGTNLKQDGTRSET